MPRDNSGGLPDVGQCEPRLFESVRKLTAFLLPQLLKRNGILEKPLSYSDIKPVPVYEESAYSLAHFIEAMSKSGEISLGDGLSVDVPPVVSRCKVEIHYLQKSMGCEGVKSYYGRYRWGDEERIRVVLTAPRNYCFTRFLVAKELCHYYLDGANVEVPNIDTDSLEKLDELMECLLYRHSTNSMVMADDVAFHGALELLVPKSWRPSLIELHDQAVAVSPENGEKMYHYLAHLVRVPEVYLKTCLDDERALQTNL
ncbi:hypothetical protein AGMMS49545_19120 [Betaproteobacteria bacterium]|nr:hypothetical protein AGMMS49545_19120 [Betaproteobacteria bacterium]